MFFSVSDTKQKDSTKQPTTCFIAQGAQYETLNKTLADSADGQLAKVVDGSLKGFSLTAGHTNQMNRCVYYEVRCEIPEISAGGKINKPMLLANDANWKIAVEDGFPWLCIDPILEEHFPQLIIMIIEADNLGTQIAKQDNVWTLCWKVHKAAALQVELTKCNEEEINWDEVKTSVCRTELNRSLEIPDIIAFVKGWCGGLHEPCVLREVDAFAKTVKVARNVPCIILGKLAALQLGVGIGACWRAAVLKAMLSAEAKHNMPNGENTTGYVTVSDVTAMQGRHKKYVLMADELMVKFRTIVKAETTLDPTEAAKLIGKLDVCLVAHVLQRPSIHGVFKSLSEICYKVSASTFHNYGVIFYYYDDDHDYYNDYYYYY